MTPSEDATSRIPADQNDNAIASSGETSDWRFRGDQIGQKFSDLFPDVRFTERQLDSAFLTARLVSVTSRDIARKMTFPGFDRSELEVVEAEPDITGKPVRGVLSRSAVAHKGWFFSQCADRVVPWESRPELKALVRLDCRPRTTSLVMQPLTLEYLCPVTDRKRRAYPDIFIEDAGVPLLLEIKKDLFHLKPVDIARYVLLEKLFERASVAYRGWDEAAISEEPAFSNAAWLARYKSITLDDSDRLDLLRAFETQREMPLRQLSGLLDDRHQTRCFAMILRGWLAAEVGVFLRDDPWVAISASLKGATL